MTEEEIKINNCLIAEFMGGKTTISLGNIAWDLPDMPGYQWVLCYDSSWDWLMPVVDKIDLTNYVAIRGNYCGINKTNYNEFNAWIAYEGGKLFHPTMTKLEAVYLAVIKFIKWYNANKKENL